MHKLEVQISVSIVCKRLDPEREAASSESWSVSGTGSSAAADPSKLSLAERVRLFNSLSVDGPLVSRPPRAAAAAGGQQQQQVGF